MAHTGKDLRGGASRYDYAAAADWIDTDPAAVVDDVRRLGLDEAARYQVELARERVAGGDSRWLNNITAEAIRDVLRDRGLVEED